MWGAGLCRAFPRSSPRRPGIDTASSTKQGPDSPDLLCFKMAAVPKWSVLGMAAIMIVHCCVAAAAETACPATDAGLYSAPSDGFMTGHAIPHSAVAATPEACRDLCSADGTCAAFQFSEELAEASAALQAKHDLPQSGIGGVSSCGLKSKLGAPAMEKAYQKTFV